MPVEIADWNDLDNVRNDLTGDYVLVNDLDSGTNGYAGIGDDFEPIGRRSFDANAFGGTFDGDGFSIQDIQINTDGTDRGCGLFGGVEGEDPSLMNISVSGVYSGVFSEDFAGGLVGSFEDGTIQNCVSHVDVTSDGERVGGLVGDNNGDTLTESYATGSVEGDVDVGGLVGRSGDTVTESYATGSVEGVDRVGGLAGRNEDTVTESYATGSVEGDEDVGGLVASSFGDEIDSYWDTETTGQSTSDGDGTGLTTAEMQGSEAETNMDGFDFASVWDSVLESDGDANADGYPILIALDREKQLDAQGILVLFDLSVQTNPATDISTFSATLNGELIELDEEADDADVFFEFGENVADSQTPIQTLTEPAPFDELVDELTNNTTFEFRAVAEAQDADNETITDEGEVLTFTTDNTQIDIQTDPATDVGAVTAVLNGEVTDVGEYSAVDTFFEFGDTAVDDRTTEVVQISDAQMLSEKAGLISGQTFDFRAVAIGTDDGERYEGDTLTFTADTTTIEGVINPDDPIEGAVVKAENKSTGESYGRDETDAQGQYAFEDISGLEIGQMLELLVDAKRPEEDESLSTVLAPTVGEPGN